MKRSFAATFIAVLFSASLANAETRVVTNAADAVNWSAGVSYTYDGAGNISQIGNDRFVYDEVGRLVQATVNGVQRNYEYDAFGNRTKCQQPEGDCQYGMTVSNETNRVDGVGYDGAGNVVSFSGETYAYDEFNMATRGRTGNVQTREFIYTADDERIATYTVGSSWNWTLRDNSGKVLRQFSSSDGQDGTGTAGWSWSRDYVWRDGQLLASRHMADADNVATDHYHLDHLGTPRRVTDDRDNTIGFHDYYAFGPEVPGGLNESFATNLKYTAHERDTSIFGGPATLDYMHARYYSPALGRFLSLDPGRSVDPAEPQSWNRYAYALNDPMNLYDEDGMVPKSVTFRLGRFSFHLDWTHSSRVPAPHFDVKVGARKVGRFQIDKWAGEAGSKIPQSAVTALEEAAEEGALKAPVMRALRQYAPKAIKIAGRAALIVGLIIEIADADDLNADDDRAKMAAADQLARELFGKPISQLNSEELAKFYEVVQSGQSQPEQSLPKRKPCAPAQPTTGGFDQAGHPTPPDPPNC